MTYSKTMGDPPPHVVILGSGFAAWQLVRKINRNRYRVSMVSPRSHFLFTPLLMQVASGTVASRNILEPVRSRKHSPRFVQAACEEIHADQKELVCKSPFDSSRFVLNYDRLVIAVGARNRTFGIPGVSEHAIFLKEIQDAEAIRGRVLACLERAALPNTDPDERRRLLHWVVVGGGPTGAECAADLEDFKLAMAKVYPEIADQIQITLLEALDDLLSSFDKALRAYAEDNFRREGIQVRTHTSAKEVLENEIILKSGERISCGLIVWSTGIEPRPFIQDTDLPKSEKGFLLTDDFCRVKGSGDIYAIGDTAMIEGRALPATAQVAQQQGKYLGGEFNRQAKGKSIRAFRFHSRGQLAYVGEGRALADLPAGKFKGRKAWWLWRSVYLTKLVGWANKFRLLMDWLFNRRGGYPPHRFT